MYYSKSSKGFFLEAVSQNMPSDAVKITKERHQELLDGQPNGFLIDSDENGYPVLVGHSSFANLSPLMVTRAQGKAALIRAGLWQDVVDFVNSIVDTVEKAVAEVALNDTTHWQRSSPFLNSAAEALGLTDAQLDQLFIDASKIEL